MRWRVYETLYRYGAMTGRELDQLMACPKETRTSYHKRLPELEYMGVAYVVEERCCRVTGQLACVWDVTDGLPGPPPKPQRAMRIKLSLMENTLKALKSCALKNGSLPADLIARFVDQALQ